MHKPPDSISWEQYKRDLDWLHENHGKLTETFNNCWVAVSGEGVVANSADLSDLMDQLKSGPHDPARTVIEFISKQDDLLVMPL